MSLTSLAIEFHCSSCGAEGMGVFSIEDSLFNDDLDLNQNECDDRRLCPRCGSTVITPDYSR